MMPSIIKPYNDNDLIMNLATTTSAPENAAATNAKHNNQKHQFTNAVIDKLSVNLLKYRHLTKGPQKQSVSGIWKII